MLEMALVEFSKAETGRPNWPVAMAADGYVSGGAGQRDAAGLMIKRLQELAQQRYVTPYGVALVFVGLGKKDDAFFWLNKALDDRSHWLVWLNLDPRWNSIRKDSRFKKLTEQVGLKS
jgi:hypothetical protein